MEPLLLISNGTFEHLYHKRGFEWDEPMRRSLGDAAAQSFFKQFDKCQGYLENHPYPWQVHPDLPYYIERN
jgi:hypothetical protein